MKRILYLLILFSGVAFAQPAIQQPVDLQLCDDNNDGFGVFNLSVNTPTVLGSLNPSLYTLTYHESMTDAELGSNPITNETAYSNFSSNQQQIYVRVEENADTSNYSLASFSLNVITLSAEILTPDQTVCEGNDGVVVFQGYGSAAGYTFTYSVNGGAIQTVASGPNGNAAIILGNIGTSSVTLLEVSTVGNPQCISAVNDTSTIVVNPNPVIGQPVDLFSSTGTFNLTDNDNLIVNGSPSLSITYYPSLQDAQNGTNAILNPSLYTSPLIFPHLIGARAINNSTGCFTITSFYLYTTNGDLDIPSQITQNICDDSSDGMVVYNLENSIPTILGALNPAEHSVSFYATQQNASNNTNPIANTNNYVAGGMNWAVYARVQNTTNNLIGFSTVLLSVKRKPVVFPIPDLVVYQGSNFTGTASFNFLSDVVQSDFVTIPNESGTISANFYTSEADAINQTNPILGISNYTNISNPQTIYIAATNTSDGVTGCEATISSFVIRVEAGDEDIVVIPDANFKAKLLEADVTNSIAQNATFQNMKIDANNDGEIQISEARAVRTLTVINSNIADLTGLNSFIFLTTFNATNNNITNVDTSNLHFMINFFVNDNPLEQVNFVDLSNIVMLNVSGSNLTSIDLSNIPRTFEFFCFNMPNLTNINAKNGVNGAIYIQLGEWALNVPSNTTALNLLCADEFNISSYRNQISAFPNTDDVMINSYCSFNSDGNNTISGTVTYDFGNDGCDATDITRFTKVVINDGTEEGASFTNQSGQYQFFTQAGNFTLSTEIENPSFFNVTPAQSTVTFLLVDESEEVVNFCITPNGVHPDLEVVIAPVFPARPGFQATYKIVYRNKGNQVLSQQYGVNFFYNQQIMTFVSATVTPETQGPGGMNWSYTNLMPFEERSIEVTMLINAPTDATNPVNIGDVLTFTSVISPQANDENVIDNTFIFNQTVVGAYDPNDITCIEGETVSPTLIGEELHYLIRFENTGNFYAENVVVAMDINPDDYDVSSLKVLSSSHNVNARVIGNKVEFFFNGIFLDTGGHGNVLLVMKSNAALSEGDLVMSKANIYFDYNFPIITNDAVTVFQTLSNPDFEIDKSVKIYPNPTNSLVNISGDFNIKSIQLFDVQGRLLQTTLLNDTNATLDLTPKAKGLYFIKVISEAGIKVEKLIKK
jgi:hypothetical protein